MTLKDISNGPDWILWAVFIVFAATSIALLSGHGANMIAGYNTASKEEKNKYNTKKLCRVTGAGMAVIAILILVMAVGEAVLPASFAYMFFAITIIDCVTVIVLANTICKK